MHILEKRLNSIRGRLKNRTIYAMGSQENLSRVADSMKRYSLKIEAVLDNDVRKRNTHAMFDVFLPSDKLKPYKKDAVILIYSPGYWQEMVRQLQDLGYMRSQIFVLNDKYTGTGGIRAFAGSTMRIYYGRRIYSEIVRDIDGDFEILLMRGATGDVYLNGLFLKDYMNRHKEKSFIITGDSKGLKKVLGMFDLPIKKIVPLDMEETSQFHRYCIFRGMENAHVKNTFLWHGNLKFNPGRLRLTDRFNFMDTYRYMIYQAGDGFKAIPPHFVPSADVKDVMQKHGLAVGKTVVLSPIAYSVKNLPVWFWRILTEKLKENGYNVCANLQPSEAEGFDFLTPLMLPFDSCVEWLEKSGYFIALRSGFCDIVSSAACKKLILYPSNKEKVHDYDHRCDLAFSGLNNMGLCDDAIEIESEAIDDIFVSSDYKAVIDSEEELHRLIDKVMSYFPAIQNK